MVNKIMTVLSITILILVILSSFNMEQSDDSVVKIGVSDDMSGFVVDYMIRQDDDSDTLEAYFIKDCCAKTSQWALTSGLMDMGIICVSAAEAFIENNPSFVAYAPVAMNTDVFLIKDSSLKRFGVTQNRTYQLSLVKDNFGSEIEIVPMISQALPYALEKNELQGALIDVTKAMQLEGSIVGAGEKSDYVSYVLVVNRNFIETKAFENFVHQFNRATDQLVSDQMLYSEHLSEYIGEENVEKGVHQKWKVKLLSIEEN